MLAIIYNNDTPEIFDILKHLGIETLDDLSENQIQYSEV